MVKSKAPCSLHCSIPGKGFQLDQYACCRKCKDKKKKALRQIAQTQQQK